MFVCRVCHLYSSFSKCKFDNETEPVIDDTNDHLPPIAKTMANPMMSSSQKAIEEQEEVEKEVRL